MSLTTAAADCRSVYATVTERIVAALERGVAPWVCPWDRIGGKPRKGASGHRYKGINVVLTGMSGFGDARWFTYHQARQHGGQVRRGEKGTSVVYWQFVDRRGADGREYEGDGAAPNGRTSRVPFAKAYTVFNTSRSSGSQTRRGHTITRARRRPGFAVPCPRIHAPGVSGRCL